MPPAPEDTSVTITPGTADVEIGQSLKFKATVIGINNPSQDVVWSVSGNESEGTIISSDGELTVGIDETATVLTVTAEALADRDVLATAIVTVTTPDPSDTGITITPAQADVEIGQSLNFSAVVKDGEGSSHDIVWSVSGNESIGTVISIDGELTVALDETSTTLTVTAVSIDDPEVFATVTVTVIKPAPVVTGITISPGTAKVKKGQSVSFSATVSGMYDPSQDVNWTLSGKSSSGTSISSNGVLTVGIDETAATLIVTAISAANPKVSSSVIVTLTDPDPVPTYTVIFDKNGGDNDAVPSSRTVEAGQSLGTLPQAPTRSGYTFTGWNTEADGNGTTFTANTPVNSNMIVYAQWWANTSGGGGGIPGGGSGGIIPPGPSDEEPDTGDHEVIVSGDTVTVRSTVTADTNESGKATASVSKEHLNSAVSTAVTEAKQSGGSARVEIKVEAPADAASVEASVPKDAVKSMDDSGLDAFTVSTHVAEVTFDKDALGTIANKAEDDIRVTASKVNAENLGEEVRQQVGDRPVLEFSVTSGGTTISQFGGNVTVSVPYTPKAGEDINAIVIYYINAEGKLEVVTDCVYDPSTGTVRFTTNHFSKYAVGYNKVSFRDAAENAWYSKAVSFIAARGITQGTGNGNFSPEAKLTRGQFIVMLLKAYGTEPAADSEDNFADAGNTYYTDYLATAKRLGISKGIGNNMFGPNQEITRQEMFTMLYNTLKILGRIPEGTSGSSLTSFSDAGDVAPWATEAMNCLLKAGIVSGNNGRLFPNETTNRAQMAQVLYNLFTK